MMSWVSSVAPISFMRSPGSAREAKPTAASDQAIRDRIVAELAGQSWAPIALINVIVRGGVVELWGAITDERERAAIMVAAENAPGVKAVNDHLAWVDPMSGMVFCPSDEEVAQAKASMSRAGRPAGTSCDLARCGGPDPEVN